MIKDEKASLSIKRIAVIAIMLLGLLGVSVMATSLDLKNIKIILSNNYEMDVLTTKTTVEEVLEENHIIVLPDEAVVPNVESNIENNNMIAITKISEEGNNVIKLAEENNEVSMEQILGDYTPVVEKILTEQVEIPFETITKEAEGTTDNSNNTVITEGENGLKEITYKVKYRNEVEIERTVLQENIIKEPINKVIQVNKKVTTTRSSTERKKTQNSATTSKTNTAKTTNTTTKSTNTIAKKVEGKTPIVKKFNTSAYCAYDKCCGKANGITSSGNKASSWYTIAAGSNYPIGTIIYIPYLKDKPNGGWFVVQDRGGAISNNKLDIYMGTHLQALQYGRKTLECYVYM